MKFLAASRVQVRILFFLGASLITACSNTRHTTKTLTDFQVFIPPAAKGYELPPNEKIVLGEPLTQIKPIYPEALISRGLPEREICLEIEIDEQGVIYKSTPLYGIPGCPQAQSAVESGFVTAAQSAVMNWRFRPSIVCTFQKGVDAHSKGNDCVSEGAKVEPIAIKLAFVFTFTQTRGVAQVRTGSLQ